MSEVEKFLKTNLMLIPVDNCDVYEGTGVDGKSNSLSSSVVVQTVALTEEKYAEYRKMIEQELNKGWV
jgi:hypothetical protein